MSTPEGESGKKSWRQSDGGGGESSARPEGEKESPTPSPAPTSRPRRYLGGQTSSSVRDQTPIWYRLLLPSTALGLILSSLVALAFLVTYGCSRPVLIAWSVTDYRSRSVPRNAFGNHDVQALRNQSAFDMDRVVTDRSPQERAYFETVFDETVAGVANETLVIYVSAHGIVDASGEPVLLTASGETYPVRAVLQKVGASPSPNKLLILDATRIPSEFELGLLGNDFAQLLAQEFDRQAAEETWKGNFWVYVSSSPGECAWWSREYRHSVFGVLVAYALRGAGEVDTRDVKGKGSRDNTISALELVEFVSPRVSAWSRGNRDDSPQNPMVLRYPKEGAETDFAIRQVDPTVVSNVLALSMRSEAESQAKPAKKEASEPEKPSEGEAPAEKEKEEEPNIAEPWKREYEDLEKRLKGLKQALAVAEEDGTVEPGELQVPIEDSLQGLWEFRDRIAGRDGTYSESIPSRRPYAWAALEDGLLYQERRLLAGEVEGVVETLTGEDLVSEIQSLIRPFENEVSRPNWTLIYADVNLKDDPLSETFTRFDRYIEDSKDKKVFDAETVKTVEVALAKALDGAYFVNEQWQAPMDFRTVRSALEIRGLAERAAEMPDPRMGWILRGNLEEADAQRRAGERSLLLGRTDRANDVFRVASTTYRNIDDLKRGQLASDLQTVRETARHLVYYVRWLGADPANESRRGQRDEEIQKLEDVIEGMRSFDPESKGAVEDLRQLALECGKLREFVSRYLDYRTIGDSRWRKPLAAFELGFLPAADRATIRGDLLSPSTPDEDPLRVNRKLQLSNSGEYPANPYPLAGFAELLGGSAELAASLRRLGPLSNADVLESDTWEDDVARDSRFRAGQEVAQLLSEKLGQSVPPVGSLSGPKEIWQTELTMLAVAPLKLRVSDDWREDEFFRSIDRRYREEWLRWQLDRLQHDNSNLPNNVYGEPTKLVEQSIVAMVKDASFRDPRPRFRLKTKRMSVGFSGLHEETLLFEADRAVGEDEPPKLVLDWFTDDRVQFQSAAADSAADAGMARQLTVPLRLDPRRVWVAPIQARQVGGVSETTLARVRARVESGNWVDWLDFEVALQPQALPDAELVYSDGSGVARKQVDVYPNQTVELGLRIRKNVDGKLSATVELDSGGETIAWPVELSEGGAKQEYALPLPKEVRRLRLRPDSSEGGYGATIRLRRDGTDLGIPLQLSVSPQSWNHPNSFQVAPPKLDPEDRVLTTTIRRVGPEPTEAIPVRVGVDGMPGVGQPGVIDLGQREARVVFEIPRSVRGWMIANIDIAGVPRAFRYEVDLSGAVQPRQVEEKQVRIASPRNEAVFERDAIPDVELHVDGVKARDPILLFLGDSRLLDRVEMVGGRQFELGLVLEPEKESMRVESVVRDVRAKPFRTPPRGRVPIKAVLRQSGEDVGRGDSIDLYFLPRRREDLPSISVESTKPGKLAVPLGGSVPIEAVIAVLANDRELAGAIDHVDFRFSRIREFDPVGGLKATPLSGEPRVRLGKDGRVTESFSTQGLKETGSWYLAARPNVLFESDRLAREEGKDAGPLPHGPDAFLEFEVVEAPAPGTVVGTNEPLKKGTLVVQVKYFGKDPARGAKVTAEGPESKSGQASLSDGTVEWGGLTPGMYTIKAEYSKSGTAASGQSEVELKPGATKSVTVEVR